MTSQIIQIYHCEILLEEMQVLQDTIPVLIFGNKLYRKEINELMSQNEIQPVIKLCRQGVASLKALEAVRHIRAIIF